jgi:short-subunit dehydrogenase
LLGGLGLMWLARRLLAPTPAQLPPGTAVVTGASSGIGEAFARRLAADGYRLLLVARREQRLAELATELQAAHGVEVETIACDLSTLEGIARVSDRLQVLPDLVYLVNNAGFGYRARFWETPVDVHQEMIRLHVEATVALTHAALPGMLARNQGAIINVSSIAGFLVLPWNNSYSSTKRYLIQHSQGLAIELANTNVRVQALCPGLTHSEFHDRSERTRIDKQRLPSIVWLTSERVAADSLAVARRGRPVVFVPGRRYRALTILLRSNLVQALLPIILPRLSLIR